MENILRYIRQGKGRGMLFVLAAAVLITMFLAVQFKQVYAEIKPKAELIVSDFLPITVQGGKIVSPMKTYKKYDVALGEDENGLVIFPIVLDTRADTSKLPDDKFGLFVMTDKIYLASGDKTERIDLVPDGTLNKNNFSLVLDKFAGYFSVVMSIISVAGLFLFGMFEVFVAVLLGAAALAWMKKPELLGEGALVRLNALLVSAALIIWFVCRTWLGVTVTNMQLFFVVLAMEAWFIWYEHRRQIEE